MDSRTCPKCGTASLVTITRNDEGMPLHQICTECERRRTERERGGLRKIGSGFAKLMLYGGTLLALLSLSADRLAISGRAGFGWRQITGAEIGVLCLILGFLAGRGLVATFGLFLLVASVGADVLQLGRGEGLGWRSQSVLIVAAVLVVAGMIWQRLLNRHDHEPPRLTR
jgi:hypothetical protein